MPTSHNVLFGLTLPLFVAPLAASCGSENGGPNASTAGPTTSGSTGSSGGAPASSSSTESASSGSGGSGGEGGAGGGSSSVGSGGAAGDMECGDGIVVPDQLCLKAPIALDAGGAVSALAVAEWKGKGGDILYGRGGEVLFIDGDGAGSFAGNAVINVAGGVGSPINDIDVGQLDTGANLDIVVGSALGTYVIFGDGAGNIAFEGQTDAGKGTVLDVHVADLIGSGPAEDIIEATEECGAVTMTSGTADASYKSASTPVCMTSVAALRRCSFTRTCAVSIQDTTIKSAPVDVAGATIGLGAEVVQSLEDEGLRIAIGKLDAKNHDDAAIIVAGDRINVLFDDGENGWDPQGAVYYASYAVGAGPADIAIGDLDGDGDGDVAVANAGDDTVSVLLNDGSGALTTTVTVKLPAGAAPSRMALGDLNGDSIADIVLATKVPDDLIILRSKP